MISEQLANMYAVIFFTAIIVFAMLETVAPRRTLTAPLRTRWLGNIGVTVIGTVGLRALLPITGMGFAVLLDERGYGLFNVIELSPAVSIVLALLLLDLARYVQHVMMHRSAFLWRLHRLHHTDQDVDFTTEFRVHPFELLTGAALGFLSIALLGPPVLALIIFNTIFAVQAFWTHSNVRFPERLDRWVRLVFTTPEVHRIHHSVDMHESNSNLGAMLTVWDRAFGTFVDQPALGHEKMRLGLAEFDEAKHSSLSWMLLNPLLQEKPIEASTRMHLVADKTVAS